LLHLPAALDTELAVLLATVRDQGTAFARLQARHEDAVVNRLTVGLSARAIAAAGSTSSAG
jgi:hypothetical protein